MLNNVKKFVYFDRAILTCLCLLFFCLPFAKAGVSVFVSLAIFLWMLKRALGYRADSFKRMLPWTELNKALGLLFVVNILSLIFSANFELSMRGLIHKELKFILIYFMLVEVINSKARLRSVLITIIASAALIIADAGVQYFRGVDFLRGYYGARLSASFSAANLFAGWLITITPLFFGLLVISKKKNRIIKALLLALFIMLLICLIMTYSRGGWLGFFIGFSLMLGYSFKKLSQKTKLSCLLICVILFISFLILPQSLKNKMAAIGDIDLKYTMTLNERIKLTLNQDNVNDFPVRFNLWKESIGIIKDYPLVGSGLNTYSTVVKDYKIFDQGGMYSHNSFLQKAAETGLLGLFAFLWVLFIFFKTCMLQVIQKNDFLTLGLMSGLLAFLIHAFFDTHLYSLQLVVLFWYMLGLTMAVIKIKKVSL